MNNLTRWDPFREMMTLRNAMDRLFEGALVNPEANWMQMPNWDLSMDVSESDEEYLVKASLPGINPDDLEITYNNNVLTIKGEIQEDKDVKERRYHIRERRHGAFSRSITLPSTVNMEAIDATYDAGELTLHLPKVEEAKPRRILVQKTEPHKFIEGRSKDIASKK